jgi:uncharacterized protein
MAENKITPSSLIQFSVSNFGCFRDNVEFSMASRKDAQNVFHLHQTGDYLLKSSIIYGPNASGKSTLLNAMAFMDSKIRKSWEPEHEENLEFSPFLMEEHYDEMPSSFEMIFLLGKTVYQYGFSIFPDHTIDEEFLKDATNTEKEIFRRKKQNFNVNKNKGKSKLNTDQILHEKTGEKTLLLTMADLLNIEEAKKILDFFRGHINFFKGYKSDGLRKFTAERSLEDSNFKKQVIGYLQKADFCITDFNIREREENLPKELQKFFEDRNKKMLSKFKTIDFSHSKYDKNRNIIGETTINISGESQGTQTFFDELGPMVDTLENGKVLVIDELNSRLHPHLCKFIIDLFHSPKTNPNNAQLIFTTHDVSLFNKKDIDRDQFWFTERDKYGRATLFSLAEFKERKGSDFQKRYLEGKYGALPFIDNIDSDLFS